MKQSKCPSCGAANAIPATGLELVCEYCGFSRPVPDVERRREQHAKEAEAQRRAEERAHRRAEAQAQRQAERQRQATAARYRWASSLWARLTGLLLPLGITGFVFYQVGLLDPLLLGSGLEALEQQLKLLTASGYTLRADPQSKWALVPKQAVRLTLADSRCYALALAAGPELSSLTLSRGQLQRPDAHTAIITFCQREPAAITAELVLKGRGRYSWALLEKKLDPGLAKASEAAPQDEPAKVRFPKGCLVRRQPAAGSPVLGRLSAQETYPVLERRGRWIKLQLKGKGTGWAGCAAEDMQ